jgi:hypothetical protein
MIGTVGEDTVYIMLFDLLKHIHNPVVREDLEKLLRLLTRKEIHSLYCLPQHHSQLS